MLFRLFKELAALKPDIVLASQFGDLIFAGLAGRLMRRGRSGWHPQRRVL